MPPKSTEPTQPDRYPSAPAPMRGRSHDCEPDDTEDQDDAVWFEHVDGEFTVRQMPPGGLSRAFFHEAAAWRIGHSCGLEFQQVADLVFTFLGDFEKTYGTNPIPENALPGDEETLWCGMRDLLLAAGYDVYESDTRFLVFPSGLRKECAACPCGPETDPSSQTVDPKGRGGNGPTNPGHDPSPGDTS